MKAPRVPEPGSREMTEIGLEASKSEAGASDGAAPEAGVPEAGAAASGAAGSPAGAEEQPASAESIIREASAIAKIFFIVFTFLYWLFRS